MHALSRWKFSTRQAGFTLAEIMVACAVISVGLVAVAIGLGRQNQQYLIGKALDHEAERDIAAEIGGTDGIDSVLELLTMRLGPDEVLVAARVDLSAGRSGDEFEQVADEIDLRIQQAFPQVRHVFIDPTSPAAAPEAGRLSG